ncbi:hypothetical protein PR048_018624 [Dryococelus australis]|uniref:Uncharacterized protein n=1 Tax=Dryococelus australis TaxID=614101 RepID=A0ABQ9HCT3_9NEOP|nr:hypothetical protein PR048_018624 [Dryococelus australis]
MHGSFSQYLFDNADVNVDTLDGSNTLHAMGGIQCLTHSTTAYTDHKIKRLKIIPIAKLIWEFADKKHPISHAVTVLPNDFAWLLTKWKGFNVAGWNGFMEKATSANAYSKSRILYLPFINAPPSSCDTIHTALLTANEESRQILASNPDLSSVRVRLGGFHLLIGLQDVLSVIYAAGSADMLLGYAYSRAVRARILCYLAITKIILL